MTDYDLNIPFKHTTNITVIDTTQCDDGHTIMVQLHPQKDLVMNDYLDIEFVPKQNAICGSNGNENEENENEVNDDLTDDGKESKDVENGNGVHSIGADVLIQTESLKLKLTAKVLRKEQGTPMLKPGITCLTKGSMYHTDMSATDWE